jgi:hypothetical protein
VEKAKILSLAYKFKTIRAVVEDEKAMTSIDTNLNVLHGYDLQVQKMASDCGVTDFMIEQDK